MDSELAMRAFLERQARSDNSKKAKWAKDAFAKIKEMDHGSARDQLQAWYFLTFCLGWGYLIKEGTNHYQRHSRITIKQLERHLDLSGSNQMYLGIRPECLTTWAVIDIDAKGRFSRYHPASEDGEGIEPVLDAMKGVGLVEPLIFLSSFSGGIHLWYPLGQAIRTCELAKIIENAVLAAGLEVRDGILELRPNRKSNDSSYKLIRAPLTGEGNRLWADGLGYVEELQVLSIFWKRAQEKNRVKLTSPRLTNSVHSPSNTRGPVKSKGKLNAAKERLCEGFTGPGQTQSLKLMALQVARFSEGISEIYALRERVCELLENAPGFTKHCGHQAEILRRTYLSKGELCRTLQMPLVRYEGTTWEAYNLESAKGASGRARKALEIANEKGMRFASQNKAIECMKAMGGPGRSWWMKPRNNFFRSLLNELVEDNCKGG